MNSVTPSKAPRIGINGVGIRGGGGWSVTRDLITAMATERPDWRFILWLYRPEYTQIPPVEFPSNVQVQEAPVPDGWRARWRWVNRLLPEALRNNECRIYFDLTNLYSIHSPCSGVLFLQNTILLMSFSEMRRFLPSRFFHLDNFVKIWIQRRMLKRGLNRADRVVVQLTAVKSELVRLVGANPDHVKIIPCGFTPNDNPQPQMRPTVTAALAHDRLRVTYIAHPFRYKNHERLVRGFAEVHRQIPQAELLLSLDPDRTTDAFYAKYVANLTQIVRELRIQSAVRFLGMLTADEVVGVLRSSAMMAYPSLVESFGLPQVEAMAAGCPVVAADLPYAREVCGEAGEYFDPLEPASISQALVGLLKNPDRRAAMKQAGLERAKRYAYPVIARQYVELFESMMTQSHSD